MDTANRRSAHLRRHRCAMLALAAIAMTSMAACSSSTSTRSNGSTNDDSSAAGPRGGTYKIGVAVDETGGFAVFDQPALAGFKLGVNEINAKGGILGKYHIDLDIRDVQSDVAQAITSTKAILQDSPQFLVVPCQTETAIAAGGLGQKAHIPTISTCATSPSIPTAVGNYMFLNWPPDNFGATATAQFAESQGYKSAYLVTSPDSSYTSTLPKYFGQAFDSLGGKVVGNGTYTLDQTDFSPLVAEIGALKPPPSVIYTSMFEPQFPAFMKQLRGAGVTVPVLGADGIDTPSIVKAGAAVEGVAMVSQSAAKEGTPLAKFETRLAKAYGQENVTSYAIRGYDLATIIADAVAKAGSTNPQKVRDALATLKDVEGVEGSTTTYAYPGSNGLPIINPLHFVKIENGKKVPLTTITVNTAIVPGWPK